MKKYIFFYIVLSVNSLILSAQEIDWEKKLDEMEVNPYSMLDMMEDYYYDYYHMPETMESFITFQEKLLAAYPKTRGDVYKEIVLDYNLPFLRSYQKDIRIEHDGDLTTYWIDDFLLMSFRNLPHPCTVSSWVDIEPNDYYKALNRFMRPRYFDLNGEAIIKTEKFNSRLEKEKRKLQRKYLIEGDYDYPKGKFEEEEYLLYTFFEYRFNEGIFYYCCCDKEKFNSDMVFFEKLEELFKKFSSKHNIARIIFALPEYSSVSYVE